MKHYLPHLQPYAVTLLLLFFVYHFLFKIPGINIHPLRTASPQSSPAAVLPPSLQSPKRSFSVSIGKADDQPVTAFSPFRTLFLLFPNIGSSSRPPSHITAVRQHFRRLFQRDALTFSSSLNISSPCSFPPGT